MSGPLLVLASASPRRRDLLAGAGIALRVAAPEVEERPRPGERAVDFVLRNAAAKAEWVLGRHDHAGAGALLAADTVVVLAGRILGKPRDETDAADMLRRLSGRGHDVVTGVALYRLWDGRVADRRLFADTTAVRFRPLDKAEIAAYLATGEPLGKAGAYAIQGHGGALVEGVTGSYANVVGLPLERVLAVLAEWGHG